MLKMNPLIGTVGQWRKIFSGLDFMGDDETKKYKLIPCPEREPERSYWKKYLEYLKIRWYLRHPPKEPKLTFERI